MNNLQKLSNKYKTQTPTQRRDAVGEMVSNEAGVAEQHVLNQMRKKGWDVVKNPDAKAPMYVTVFDDGTMWCKKYASIRDSVAEDLIPHHMCRTKHDTYGMLVNYKELLNHGMLTIVSSSIL